MPNPLTGRPAALAALEVVRGGKAAGLLVAKMDRLSRSVVDGAGLMERAAREGWALHFADLDTLIRRSVETEVKSSDDAPRSGPRWRGFLLLALLAEDVVARVVASHQCFSSRAAVLCGPLSTESADGDPQRLEAARDIVQDRLLLQDREAPERVWPAR